MVRAVAKEREILEKKLFHLQAERFYCEQDAQKELIKIKSKYHTIEQLEVIDHPIYSDRGRPKTETKPQSYRYQIFAKLTENIDVIQVETLRKACFIIGTNRLDKDASEIIDLYKKQNEVELGFRFLKSPIFYAQSF